ncbi:MAG: nucleotidyltransferase family protein, partial [Candidatus Marithrix sp.]|nr:nucleotidyltransferase family protein [Candidatus Marithrix sp.]
HYFRFLTVILSKQFKKLRNYFMNDLDNFLFICRCLSFEDNRESLRKQLQKEIAWQEIVKISGQHLLTPALYWALSKKGLLNSLSDDGLVTYLKTIFEANQDRNQIILTQVHDIAVQLNQIDIEPLLMKGVASLITDTYEDIGVRMMTDIDLLIPADKLMTSVAALDNIGYKPLAGHTHTEDHHHYIPLVCDYTAASVELHLRMVRIGTEILPTEEVWRDAKLFLFSNTRVRIPSPQHRIKHNIIHTYLSDSKYYKADISLMQLYEFAMLRKTLDKQLDWDELASSFKSQSKLFHSYLAMVYYLLAQSLPDKVSLLPSTKRHYRHFQYRMRYPLYAKFMNFNAYFISSFNYLLTNPKIIWKLLNPLWYIEQFKLIKSL